MAARTMKLVANSLIKLANLVDAKVCVCTVWSWKYVQRAVFSVPYFNPAFVGYKKGSLTYKIDVFSISEGSKGFLGDLLGPPVSPDKYRE